MAFHFISFRNFNSAFSAGRAPFDIFFFCFFPFGFRNTDYLGLKIFIQFFRPILVARRYNIYDSDLLWLFIIHISTFLAYSTFPSITWPITQSDLYSCSFFLNRSWYRILATLLSSFLWTVVNNIFTNLLCVLLLQYSNEHFVESAITDLNWF